MAWLRGILRPYGPEEPNDNLPADHPPATVGPPSASAGSPDGFVIEGDDSTWWPPPVVPSAWSGWPADWATPYWTSGVTQELTDTAWMCLDKNSSVLASMPPYLVDAAPSLSADWLTNPSPDVYSGWYEFAKDLFRQYQMGEAFVLATARYATGWPASFHVVPPWAVEVELRGGLRTYKIGSEDVSDDILHIRYQSSVDQARGTGPLDAGALRLVADRLLTQYGTRLAVTGVPSGVLVHPGNISPAQAASLQQAWVAARASTIGEPAVLGGGIEWQPTQLDPEKLGLLDLLRFNQSRIAVLLGIPPFLVGLPSGGDSMTYSNVQAIFDYHWRAGLRPMAQACMEALSGWALPRGTRVELNRDAYVQPPPLERAQGYQILAGIVDPETGRQALTVDEIREAERLDASTPGVLAG